MSTFTTVSRVQFDLANPTPEMVKPEDIAYALSRICRYGGHTPTYYTVGQHSLLVAHLCRLEGIYSATPLFGLLHDAAEAYVGDVISPLKKMLGTVYTDIEDRVLATIHKALGVRTDVKELPDIEMTVKWADYEAYQLEQFVIWGRKMEFRARAETIESNCFMLRHYLEYKRTDVERAFLQELRRLQKEAYP